MVTLLMFIQTLARSNCKFVACQKWKPVRLAEKVILGIFLSFSLKAHSYYPANHIGPAFSDWKVPALWNFFSWRRFIMWSSLQRKRVLRSSWILNECNLSCNIVKNCRIIGLNGAKKNGWFFVMMSFERYFPGLQLVYWLVVWNPLKNMKVNWDDYSKYMGK